MQMELQLTLLSRMQIFFGKGAVLSRALKRTPNLTSDAFEYLITLRLPEVAVPFDLSGSNGGNYKQIPQLIRCQVMFGLMKHEGEHTNILRQVSLRKPLIRSVRWCLHKILLGRARAERRENGKHLSGSVTQATLPVAHSLRGEK